MTLHGDVISHVNISNVQVEDGGIYQCTATNRVGETSHSADMRVYGRSSTSQDTDLSDNENNVLVHFITIETVSGEFS